MLLRFSSIVLAVAIQAIFAAGQDFAPPEILAGDSDSDLLPLAGQPTDGYELVDGSKVIRGLLGRRQQGCSASYFSCGSG